MRNIYTFFIMLLVASLFSCCSNGDEEGINNSDGKNMTDIGCDSLALNACFTSLQSTSQEVESCYQSIIDPYFENYSGYAYDTSHQASNVIYKLMSNDSSPKYEDYALALLLKGTFTADTTSKKWVYSFSSALKFLYPDKSGNKCAMELSIIKDSSLIYNAIQVKMERNDSLKAVVVMKHLVTRVTLNNDNVITISRSKYGSTPAVLSCNISKRYIDIVFTADTASFSKGKLLLSNKFNCKIQMLSTFNLDITCSDFAKFCSYIALTRIYKTNETEYKKYLEKADSFLSLNLYSSSTHKQLLGTISFLPYQRNVNGVKEWYACCCLNLEGQKAIKLLNNVDVTELFGYFYNTWHK